MFSKYEQSANSWGQILGNETVVVVEIPNLAFIPRVEEDRPWVLYVKILIVHDIS